MRLIRAARQRSHLLPSHRLRRVLSLRPMQASRSSATQSIICCKKALTSAY